MEAEKNELLVVRHTIDGLVLDAEDSRHALLSLNANDDQLKENVQRLHSIVQEVQEEKVTWMCRWNDVGAFLKAIETKRIWSFIDETMVKSAPRMYEIENIHKSLAALRVELLDQIEDSKNTVKFDLLHDASPQISRIKVSECLPFI